MDSLELRPEFQVNEVISEVIPTLDHGLGWHRMCSDSFLTCGGRLPLSFISLLDFTGLVAVSQFCAQST